MAEDLTREAQKIWNALRVMVDQEIDKRTASCVRSRKMTVMSAPNGHTVGVSEPFGQTINIPYSSALANVKVGDTVWVDWKFDNASTMVAMSTGDGQIVPDYFDYNDANRNLLEARKFIQTSLTNDGDLTDPTADSVYMDYAGISASNYYIHVQPSTNYRLTLYDTRNETEEASCIVAQYAANGAFISLAASGIGWREPQGMTFVTNVNASFLRLSLVGFPKYRWKLERGDISTDWQPSPEDISPYVFDSTPIINSQNPVTSGGVYDAISNIDVSDKVSKYGDEMTGNYKITGNLNVTYDMQCKDLTCRDVYGNVFHGTSTSTEFAKSITKDTSLVSAGTKQLINPSDLTLDYYINATGTPTRGTGDCYTGLIAVEPGDQLYYYGIAGKTGNRRFHGYYSNGTWKQQLLAIQVSSVGQSYSSSAVTIPEDVYYVRLSYTQLDTDVMVEFAPKTSYVPYGGDESLAVFKNEGGMVAAYGETSNDINDKPTGVDSFGAMSLPTSEVDYGQILISSNTNKGVYWRTAQSFSGGWEKLASASDLSDKVSKSGDTMTGYLKLPRAQFQDGDYPRITFLDSSTSTVVGSIISHNAQRRTLVRQVSSNGSEETFQFPSSLSATSSAYYDVITSKGGTMTGTLNVPTTRIYDASNPMLSFISSATDTSALAAIYSQISNRNMVLRTRGTSGYVEDFMLPNNTATGSHKNYEIFNSKEGVLAYKDQTVSVSLSANTWTEMTVTQQVAPTGYTPLTRTIADGSTTAIRGYLFLVPNNMGNTAHILLYASQAVSGTFTLRTWFVKTSATQALT